MRCLIHLFLFQDSLKFEALVKEDEDSTNLIPKLENNIPKLQKLLLDEDKVLEEITESSKGGPLPFSFPIYWKLLLIKFALLKWVMHLPIMLLVRTSLKLF